MGVLGPKLSLQTPCHLVLLEAMEMGVWNGTEVGQPQMFLSTCLSVELTQKGY